MSDSIEDDRGEGGDLTEASNRRIRAFSRWASAGLAAFILIMLPVGFQLSETRQAQVGESGGGWPWEDRGTKTAEQRGDTWYGTNAALIELTGIDTSRPLQIEPLREDGRYLPLVATAPGGAPAPTGDRIDLSHFHSYHYLVPWSSDIDIWSYEGDTGPWSVTVTAPELPECGGRADGAGGAVFVYRGDATSARFVADEHLTYSTVTTVLGTEYLGEEYPYEGPYDTSVSWEDSPYAVFVIAEGTREWETEWSLEFNELQQSTTPTCSFPYEASNADSAPEEVQP